VNHGAPPALLAVAGVAVLVESGFTPAAFAHLADLADARQGDATTAMGIYSLLLGVGQLAGVLLGTPLAARWQMDGVLVATWGLALVALIGVARMPPAQAVIARDGPTSGEPAPYATPRGSSS
jgi:MFS family permease